MKRFRVSVFILVACALIQGGCKNFDFNTFSKNLDSIIARWDAAEQTAQSTPRFALAPMVVELQGIKQELAELERPSCTSGMVSSLDSSMDSNIKGYQAFLSISENFIVQSWFNLGSISRDIFNDEYATYKANPVGYCLEQM